MLNVVLVTVLKALGFALTIAVACVLVAIIAAATVTLVTRGRYGHGPFDQDGGALNGDGRFVVQIDDFGNFWDPDAPRRALEYVERESLNTNVIVTVFVHGWHHNAAPRDDNAVNFGRSLDDLAKRLKEDVYKASRRELTGTSDVKVAGIYIGWRGRSQPGWLDYLTFWGRKEAAERVGRGDVREFLLRLRSLYVARNARDSGNTSPGLFTGLVIVGHSFGGQVVFQAVSQAIESELVAATSPHGAAGTLTGFGDMVVLLNPALEAHQFERIDSLSRQLTYQRDQTPLMLVLSAVTDSARLVFFPLGRRLDLLTKPAARPGQRERWLHALGAYAPQVTHQLQITSNESDSFDPRWYSEAPDRLIDADLTAQPRFGGVELARTGRHRPFHPFLVVNVSADVIRGHSGIFTRADEVGSELHTFLTNYVALVQGKRVLLSRGFGRAGH